MKANDRARLTSALRDHVAKIATDLRAKMRAPGAARVAAEQLHKDERVAEDFEVWTDLLSRRAAVLWVLKSVYVRVLEDRGLLAPGRLLDPEAQHLFEKLAPNLGETAFLRWIYKDLASTRGGVPELFSSQPAEVAPPSDELSRALIGFWRHRDADTGATRSFADEHFDGELMGDLYQELDPVVKDRFALCQTPDFVRAFILDRTLTPAMETFGTDEVRLLDPACGSGHFLIDGLKRLVAATATKHADWDRGKVVAHALDRVVGIDLNDYACALARTRLIMTAAELAGVTKLADAARFHPHVYWADGLEQVERENQKPSLQFSLFEKVEERPRATLTRSDVRAALRRVFEKKFHAVVANPPYITEKDAARKEYHREKTGKNQRYVSAYREYSLGSPFAERCFQLAEKSAYVGLITSNNFMKREFGKPLIEKVLAGYDLTLVVDTSQAYIPFHGTPTVLLFGRNQRPEASSVRAVMGKRGESGTPVNPAKAKVWSSIAEGWNTVGFENEYVSVADVPRETLSKHPWSLGGGGASDLRSALERSASMRLYDLADAIGLSTNLKQAEVYESYPTALKSGQDIPLVDMVIGERVRDFGVGGSHPILFPYDVREPAVPLQLPADNSGLKHFWRYRGLLWERRSTGFKTIRERGLLFYEYAFHFPQAYLRPTITFSFVATHNHFALRRGGCVFKQSAPVIQLAVGATQEQHLALLGLLNSSTACFWMKQVFYPKGGDKTGDGGRRAVEPWHDRYEHDATKLQQFPVVPDSARTVPYASRLDALASARNDRSVERIIDSHHWRDGATLRRMLDDRRAADFADLITMIALQEELDWLCYALYGLDTASDVVAPDRVEACAPTWLPWNLTFAERDAQNRETFARGEEPDEQPSDWWTRHGWEPLTALPKEASQSLKKRVEARRVRTATTPALALIETANFKRRWYKPDYAEQERVALSEWLADRVEQAAKARTQAFTLEQLVANLQDDARVLAVCEILTGRKDFSLSRLVASALQGDSVPSHRFHVYKPAGLVKREVWERTWDDQRREDAGEKVTPEVPPAYGSGDFVKPDYWRLRGKLDVPQERFIAFSEVPGRAGIETLYGWAGWTVQQRVKAILAIDEELEDASEPLADRIGLLDSAWRLLPDVAREDAAAATRLKAELQALVGIEGPSRELIADWKKRFPPPRTTALSPRAVRRDLDDCRGDDGEIQMTSMIAPLRSVRIENFRGIRDLTIELEPDVTVFFGINAAGKTTVLDALAIGLGVIASRIPKVAGTSFAASGDVRTPWKTRPDLGETAGVEKPYARITINCASALTWDVTKLRFAGDREAPKPVGTKALRDEIDPFIRQALDGGTDARWQWTFPLVAAYGTGRSIGRSSNRTREVHSDPSRLHAFDGALHLKTDPDAVLDWFVRAEDLERREREQQNDRAFRLPVLEGVRGAMLRSGLNCQNPRVEAEPFRLVVDFKHADGTFEVLPMDALSDGYRTHFALVVDIARRMVQLNPSDDLNAPDRGTNSEAVILIDEIDLHLDPTWQATVVKGLRDAFPRAQFVMTTHSEQVIGSVPARSVRKLVAGEGEVLVENVPFAEGATSERILIELMGANERAGQAGDGENTKRLTQYMAMISRGEGETGEAAELRAELEKVVPGDERLQQADLEMQKVRLLRKIKGDGR